jgi:2-polyprenyl-3-methyl-5-hydroxy-6-metoxy-1,4-benzoquinol methylase
LPDILNDVGKDFTALTIKGYGMKKCIICNNDIFSPLYNNTLKQCRACSFITANLEIDEEKLKRLYSEKYFKGEEYLDYVMEKDCLQKNFIQRLKYIQKLVPYSNIKTALELGCAYGFFAEVFKKLYPKAHYTGIDIVSEAIEYGTQELRQNLILGDFLAMDIQHNHFSDIFLWDVIEHLKDPRAFLEKICCCLQTSGRLYITTGDIGALLPRVLKDRWRLIHPPTHVHYFSKKTLGKLLAQYNFKVLNISYPVIYRSARQIFYSLFLLHRKPSMLLKKIHAKIPESLYIPINTFDIMFIIAVKL